MAMNKVSEKQLLASVEKLEIKISQLIQEKEKLSKENLGGNFSSFLKWVEGSLNENFLHLLPFLNDFSKDN